MELEPNRTCIEVTDPYYGVLEFTADDIVMRHLLTQYDHVRGHWVDEDDGHLIIEVGFYGQETLTRMESMGIPTAYLDMPTKSTIRAYEADQIARWDTQIEWNEDES